MPYLLIKFETQFVRLYPDFVYKQPGTYPAICFYYGCYPESSAGVFSKENPDTDLFFYYRALLTLSAFGVNKDILVFPEVYDICPFRIDPSFTCKFFCLRFDKKLSMKILDYQQWGYTIGQEINRHIPIRWIGAPTQAMRI